MKNRHALNFVLAATLLSMTVLTVDIPFVRAIVWSSETRLTAHLKQDMSPSMMQAGDGTIWVVWVSNRMGFGNDELFYKTSSNYGLDWSLDTRLTDALSADSTPSIMQAGDGTIWVAWASYRTGNHELFYKTFNGSSWSSDIQLTTEPNKDERPSIMQAANGRIWVVWYSNRTGNSELFYKTYNGSAWLTETQLTDDPSDDEYPSIVQASNGTIWVVWSSHRTGNSESFYKTFNGTAWSSDAQLTDDPASDDGPSIAQARDGKIWVVWQSGRPNEAQDELYYKIYDGSAWSSDTQLTSDLADDIAPSIAQINDKKIWVVWAANKDEDTFDIYYKTSSEINIHDVAITSVTPSSTTVNQGETVSISVTAENHGDYTETFNVSTYYDGELIETQNVTDLTPDATTTLTFEWDTTGVPYGNYTISANATIVPDEIDTTDNTLTDGWILVCAGEVGGIWIPVDKPGLLAPYIALASTILVATATTAIYAKRVKRMRARKHRGMKAEIRAYKRRLRYIATIVTVAILVAIIAISGFLIYSYLNPSPNQTKSSTFQLKAAIVDHLSLTQPNKTFIQTATNTLEKAGYTVDYYPGKEVTVEFYRKLPTYRYRLVVLRVHSALELMGRPPVGLFTSETYSKTKYVYEQLAGQVAQVGHLPYHLGDPLYFGINPSFVRRGMNGKFENTIIIMMGCDGLTYTYMAEAFVIKGAKVYISWNGPVSASHTDQATTRLLEHLITEKQTIKQAVATTMKAVGPDPVCNTLLFAYPEEA